MSSVCPSSEVDELTISLLNVFESRGMSFELFEALIKQEVEVTGKRRPPARSTQFSLTDDRDPERQRSRTSQGDICGNQDAVDLRQVEGRRLLESHSPECSRETDANVERPGPRAQPG